MMQQNYVRMSACQLPILDGIRVSFSLWQSPRDDDQTIVIEHSTERDPNQIPTVRIQSACVTSEVFGSLRCDCRLQLEQALKTIVLAKWGLLVYPIEHEGRGIGLLDKIRAYHLQDQGFDTFEANRVLGHDYDLRNYDGSVAILQSLGVVRLRLLTNNPLKAAALMAGGILVEECLPLFIEGNRFNQAYLEAKRKWFQAMTVAESINHTDASGTDPRPAKVENLRG